MEFLKKLIITILIAIIVFTFNCKKDITAVESFYTYTPLNVGDVRLIFNTLDSSLVLFSIVGQCNINNSQIAYIGQWNYSAEFVDTLYYFIKDGYLATTHTKNLEFPSYGAKSNPLDGDTWQPNDFSDEYLIKARYFENFTTPLGEFNEVFGFTRINKISSLAYGTVYYAKNIGYLGSAFYDKTELYSYCTYIKVYSRELGDLLLIN
jgi:hypothetical protein